VCVKFMPIAALMKKFYNVSQHNWLPDCCNEMYHLQNIDFQLNLISEVFQAHIFCTRCFLYTCFKGAQIKRV